MSTIAATVVATRKPLYQSLFVQVVVALLLGIVLGMAVPDFAVSLKIFSDAFLTGSVSTVSIWLLETFPSLQNFG